MNHNPEVKETLRFGAWDQGTRTIFETPIPLHHEIVTSGHPIFGDMDSRWITWPEKLPEKLPEGASKMGDSDSYFGAWIEWPEESADCAIAFAMN